MGEDPVMIGIDEFPISGDISLDTRIGVDTMEGSRRSLKHQVHEIETALVLVKLFCHLAMVCDFLTALLMILINTQFCDSSHLQQGSHLLMVGNHGLQ